jgi:nucleoid-associated protein YgaU
MKRDARIGLAVVLVLGLAVTLLVARAMCKPADQLANGDGDSTLGGAASYTADVPRVDGVDSARVSAASASATAPEILPPAPAADTAATPPPAGDPALQRFLDDQTRRISAPPPAPLPGAGTPPVSAGAETTGTVTAENTRPGGTPPAPAPQTDPLLLRDHERADPAADADHPKDGFAYTVASGDNIWKISSKVYGDGRYTQKIAEANPGLNPAKLKIGAVVRIPVIPHKTVLMKLPAFGQQGKVEVAQRPTGSSGPVVVSKPVSVPDSVPVSATTHKVEAGETLSGIAKKYYGASGPKTIAFITAANKGLDPAKLKVGQEIAIPAKK